jgi:two-component system, OmpR family, sensor histidine kinase MprB
MTLRGRLTLLSAGIVGVTVLLVSIVAYVALRSELRGQVDDALRAQTDRVRVVGERFGPGAALRVPPTPLREGEATGPTQLLSPTGEVLYARPSDSEVRVPVDGRDRAVAAGTGEDVLLRDTHVDGVHLRALTVAQPNGGAVQVVRSLSNVDATLSRLRALLVFLCAGATLLAALLGRLLHQRVIRPVSDLTAAAEHITQTEDLARRVEVPGDDEVGRMAARFNTMLDTLEGSRHALDESVSAQRHLVADASHELRTPVTSLRTNIEVLLAGDELPDDDRRRLLEDVRAETEELSALITDVIELARGDEPLAGVEEVQLDAIVSEALARSRRRRPGVAFEAELEPTVVEGLPDRLGRAVDNLLDNAAKYSPVQGASVEVVLRGGELTVRDHGPGIPAADRPHVFDRFYRGATARGRPGSGLGLAIVRQVVETHGGTIAVEQARGGGALFRLRLAARAVEPAPVDGQPDRAAPRA